MDKLNRKVASDVLEAVLKKISDNRARTMISWSRYNKCGANLELCDKIIKIYTLFSNQDSEKAEEILNKIINRFSSFIDDNGKTIYMIPYTTSIDDIIEDIRYKCFEIISPLKDSADKSISTLAQSIVEDLLHIRDDIKEYIFDQPFSISYNPGEHLPFVDDWDDDWDDDMEDWDDDMDDCDDDMDDCDDDWDVWVNVEDNQDDDNWDEDDAVLNYIPGFAINVWNLDAYTALFFYNAFTVKEEICDKLIDLAITKTAKFLKPYDYIIALDVYNVVQRLPRTFIRSFFKIYETDPLHYSQLLSSLERGDEREFVNLFHDHYLVLLKEHYSFLRLALSYFDIFSLQSNTLPNMKEYLSNEYDFPYESYSNEMKYIVSECSNTIESFNDHVPEITRVLEISNQSNSDNNEMKLVTQTTPQEETIIRPESILMKLEVEDNDIPSCISGNGIHKRFDVNKLVEYLTSTNKFTDKIFVEKRKSSDKCDIKDYLTYFFFPYDETIRRRIRENSFNTDFNLKWEGCHLSSLKCLIRLLFNKKKNATAENVIDTSTSDFISREFVSKQDNKSPIWVPVRKVFGKDGKLTVHSGIIAKTTSDETKKIIETEIRAIAKIVFDCKK